MGIRCVMRSRRDPEAELRQMLVDRAQGSLGPGVHRLDEAIRIVAILHARLAQSLGVPKENAFVMVDGDVLEIGETGAHLGDRVSADYVYVDGLGVGDVDHVVLRDRQHLATDGMIVVVIAVDKRSGRVVGKPDVVSRGFVDVEESEELLERTRDMVVGALQGANHIAEWGVIHSTVKEVVAKFLYEETRRRPMVLPVAVEV